MNEEGIRINKYLSECGVCSRSEADRYIEDGLVRIDDKICRTGDRVFPGQKVLFRGLEVSPSSDKVVLACNKPKGIVCTTRDDHAEQNIVDYIGYKERIYPVGRLDKDSEGLIFLTNDGALMDEILRSRNDHEKEYLVEVEKPVTKEFLEGMSKGVYLEELNVRTKPCKIRQSDSRAFRIILTQGLNRQIRRMCRAFGYHVRSLKRIRIMNIELGDLKTGQYRLLSQDEIKKLRGI